MEKVSLDLFTQYKFLSGLAISPDGAHAAFIRQRCNMETNGYSHNIWRMILVPARHSAHPHGQRAQLIWEDADTLLFPAVRKEKHKKEIAQGKYLTVFQKISIHGGEAQEAFTVPLKGFLHP